MKKKLSLREMKVKSFITDIQNEDKVVGGLKCSSVMPPKEEDITLERSVYPHVCPVAVLYEGRYI